MYEIANTTSVEVTDILDLETGSADSDEVSVFEETLDEETIETTDIDLGIAESKPSKFNRNDEELENEYAIMREGWFISLLPKRLN